MQLERRRKHGSRGPVRGGHPSPPVSRGYHQVSSTEAIGGHMTRGRSSRSMTWFHFRLTMMWESCREEAVHFSTISRVRDPSGYSGNHAYRARFFRVRTRYESDCTQGKPPVARALYVVPDHESGRKLHVRAFVQVFALHRRQKPDKFDGGGLE